MYLTITGGYFFAELVRRAKPNRASIQFQK
jgi:hypothetical protein